jgi:hypothetical protein
LKEQITQYIPAGEWRSQALDRIEMALDPAKPFAGENDMARAWAALEHPQPELDAEQSAQQKILRETFSARLAAAQRLPRMSSRD